VTQFLYSKLSISNSISIQKIKDIVVIYLRIQEEAMRETGCAKFRKQHINCIYVTVQSGGGTDSSTIIELKCTRNTDG
jgi:predicted PP-loop superfamily ATPase